MSESIAFGGVRGRGDLQIGVLVGKNRPNERAWWCVEIVEKPPNSARHLRWVRDRRLSTSKRWVILLLYLLFSLVGIFLARVLELNPRLFCMIDAKKQSSAAAVAAGTLSQSVAEFTEKESEWLKVWLERH